MGITNFEIRGKVLSPGADVNSALQHYTKIIDA